MAQRFKTDMNKLKADSGAFDTGGGNGFLKMPDGKHLLRILPTWKEGGLFYQKVGFHRPPGRENVSTKVICPDYTFGKKGTCPICKAKQRVYKQLGKDAAKDYAYQKRAYLNVLDMKAGDAQVKIFEAPATVMNPILNFMSEEDSDQLVDPNEGYNILITRKKDGGFTKYDVMIKPGEFDLEAKGYDIDDILGNLTALDKLVSEPEADDFQEVLDALNEAAFGDAEGAGEEQEDDDPPPKKLKSAKVAAAEADDDQDDPPPKAIKKKPAPAPVVEEDDEPEAEEDEPAPPPKKKKPAPAPVEEEEEEPEEEEDDAPAPPPKKTLAAKKKPQPEPVEEDDEPAPPKKKSKPAPVADDDDLDTIEDFDDTGFDADEPIPF